MPEQLNIYQKLSKIRALCEVMTKNKSGYSYKYVSVDEILSKVTAGMKKYGLSLIPRTSKELMRTDLLHYSKTKCTKDGVIYEENVNEMLVCGDITYRWVNDENPEEFIDVPWYASGSQSDPSQAFGSAMTYSLRYFLLQYFQIATLDDEDPDNWRSKQKDAENAENMEIAGQIIEQVNNIIVAYLETNPDKKPDVIAIVKKYAKENGKASANYYAIEDPIVAGKLLNEVTEKLK